jgi:hypothetical protein
VIRNLEPNTILVRTERKAPYAEAFGGVWLTGGATRELEILAGAGCTITGRVVDERKQPLEGAALRILDRPNDPEAIPPAALSGPDGRFRMEHIAARPRGVWIVRGETRPESWDPVRFCATLDNVWTETSAMPTPDKVVDVGDVRLTRAAIYAGHVLDSRGRPVGGALVSLRIARNFWRTIPDDVEGTERLSRGPADEGFELMSGECVSNDAGEFELRGSSGGPRALVWTRAGVMQDFDLPESKPGERAEGIELRLDPSTRFELDLADARGGVASASLAWRQPGSIYTNWRSGFVEDRPAVAVTARLRSGEFESSATKVCEADGIWRMQLRRDPADIEELQFAVSGCEPILESTPGGVTDPVRRRLNLVRLPEIQVRVMPTDPRARRAPTPGFDVSLDACLADPALHAKSTECCGYGSDWSGKWRGETLELALPVRRIGSYWVYARTVDEQGNGLPLGNFGPFEPGTGVHVIALDLAACMPKATAEEKTQPPDASLPGQMGTPIPTSCIRARIVDARTKQGIRGARLDLKKIFCEGLEDDGLSTEADRDGGIDDENVLVGKWTARATKRGYAPLDLGSLTTLEGQTIELGTLALEPLPMHRARIVGADGSPLPTRPWVKQLASDGSAQSNEDVEDDGSFELPGEWTGHILLEAGIYPDARRRGFSAQRFLLDPWPESELKEIRLGPLRTVVLTVSGLDPEDPDLWPYACPAPGEPTATCDHRLPVDPEHEPLARASNADGFGREHRYVMCLAPGKYQIYGSNLMHELPWTELEVIAGDTDLELTISAH